MKLPNREQAYIPSTKLSGYLLSETHSVGKSKAKLLRSVGFNEVNMGLLKKALIAIAHSEDVTETISSQHGIKYIIDGQLQTPVGTKIRMRTIWIIEAGQKKPRFVTAYPVEKEV
jgi:hypothetical protein